MATARHKGNDVTLSINGSPIAHTQSATLTINQEQLDATGKDDSRWKKNIVGDRDYELSVENLVDFTSSMGLDNLADMIDNGASADFEFTTGDTGDIKYTGTVNLSTLEYNANHNEVSGYSGTLVGTGALTKTTL